MANHWAALAFTRGETLEHFLEQFKYLDRFKSATIPWEAFGGLLADENLVKDVDGSITVRLPLRIDAQ